MQVACDQAEHALCSAVCRPAERTSAASSTAGLQQRLPGSLATSLGAEAHGGERPSLASLFSLCCILRMSCSVWNSPLGVCALFCLASMAPRRPITVRLRESTSSRNPSKRFILVCTAAGLWQAYPCLGHTEQEKGGRARCRQRLQPSAPSPAQLRRLSPTATVGPVPLSRSCVPAQLHGQHHHWLW